MPKNLVRPTSKGQVTIPKLIRRKRGISVNTLFRVSSRKDGILFQPVTVTEKKDDVASRDFNDQEIAEFLELDEISDEDRAFLNQILKTDKY